MAAPSSSLTTLDRTPLEVVSKSFRLAQKSLTRGLSSVSEAVTAVSRGERTADASQVALLRERLAELRESVVRAGEREQEMLRRTAARLEHLQRAGSGDGAPSVGWEQTRLDTMAADYLLRAGHGRAAGALVREARIEEHVDLDVYAEAGAVADAIMAQDVEPALRWCGDHASKLRRLDSQLEFFIRKEQFVALVLAERTHDAVSFGREHFHGAAGTHPELIKLLMGVLAFPSLSQAPEEYHALVAEGRWAALRDMFWSEFRRVYGISRHAMIAVLAQLGLMALKTPACFAQDDSRRSADCPVCPADSRIAAAALPSPLIHRTSLFCRGSDKVLDGREPIVCLPNGQVLGRSYVERAQDSQGRIRDPVSGEIFDVAGLRSVYIV